MCICVGQIIYMYIGCNIGGSILRHNSDSGGSHNSRRTMEIHKSQGGMSNFSNGGFRHRRRDSNGSIASNISAASSLAMKYATIKPDTFNTGALPHSNHSNPVPSLPAVPNHNSNTQSSSKGSKHDVYDSLVFVADVIEQFQGLPVCL